MSQSSNVLALSGGGGYTDADVLDYMTSGMDGDGGTEDFSRVTNVSLTADRILLWDASAGQADALHVVTPTTLRSQMVVRASRRPGPRLSSRPTSSAPGRWTQRHSFAATAHGMYRAGAVAG